MGDSRSGQVLGHLQRWLGSAAAPADDGKLLERFVHQRDEDAFAELVCQHGPLVFGLCRRLLGNVQDAEDVFQATFLVLARKAATIRKPESLSCWLHGVAYRLALKARDEAKRRRIHEQQAHPRRETVEIDLSWSEVRGLLDEELQRLPEKQSLPLVLCYLEGLTQDEASRRLGWPRGTLKRRLEAGRERLRLRLTRRGVTLGASLFAAALTESASRGAVPMILRSATVRAAMQFVAHESAALAATPAVLLAKGALQTMLTTKLKLGAMAILLLGCAVTAAGLAIPQASPEKQPEKKTDLRASARPAEDKHTRKDRYGDPLPPGAIARLGTVRLRHQGVIAAAVFTPDSNTVIVGDSAGDIISWDVVTGRKIRQYNRTSRLIDEPLALSADGKTLVCCTWGGGVELWDVQTGKRLAHHPIQGRITQLLLTPDGKTLIVGDDSSKKSIQLWDIAGKKKRHELKGHKGRLFHMALSPDGKTLATESEKDRYLHLWDVATGKEKCHFAAYDGGLRSVAFSPDGKTLVTTGTSLCFWDAATGNKLREQRTVHAPLNFAYSPNGKILAGCEDDFRLHVYDAASGKHLCSFNQTLGNGCGPIFSPDSKTIATYSSPTQTLYLCDAASGRLLHSTPGHRSCVTALVFADDGKTMFSAAGLDPEVGLYVWDADTGTSRDRLGVDSLSRIVGLTRSPVGKMLAVCGHKDNTTRLWGPGSHKEICTLRGYSAPVESVVWSADAKMLASSSFQDRTIRLWDATSGKLHRTIEANLELGGGNIALSPDSKMVAACGYRGGAIRLWSADSGKELPSIATSQDVVFALAFSPDGSILASGGLKGGIHLWDAISGRLRQSLEDNRSSIGSLVFSRDGRTLVSGHGDLSGQDEHAVRLWEVATGRERACFLGHRGGIRSVAMSRDGRRIASGSADTTILIWDATGGARPDAALSAEQLRTLWRDLSDADAGRAARALWQFALSPKHALPFLTAKLHPAAPLDAAQQKQVDRLLADLDSEQFTIREQAEIELEKRGLIIEPVLRKALESKPSLEVRRRIEKVLERLASERLRITRALEAIEHMNAPGTQRLLEALADGAPRARLTEEARVIRKRLAEQSVPVPEK